MLVSAGLTLHCCVPLAGMGRTGVDVSKIFKLADKKGGQLQKKDWEDGGGNEVFGTWGNAQRRYQEWRRSVAAQREKEARY